MCVDCRPASCLQQHCEVFMLHTHVPAQVQQQYKGNPAICQLHPVQNVAAVLKQLPHIMLTRFF